MTTLSVVIPNWNGLRWLPACLGSLAAQELAPDEVIVVDNGSTDGSLSYLAAEHPDVRVIALERNTGFAHAANRGIAEALTEYVALVNTDVELAPDWTRRMAAALDRLPRAGSAACKMLQLGRAEIIYDAGDVLRRDGQCLQRGRFECDDGRYDDPGETFGACAGAGLYRRVSLSDVGGFDERFFAYLEDADLALRLRLAGWCCVYEPVVAWHAGGGSSGQLERGYGFYVQRNTLLLVAKAFPWRWTGLVVYRQLALARIARREHRLAAHLRATLAVLPLLPYALQTRAQLRRRSRLRIETVIPRQPMRGPSAAGHPSHHAPPPEP